MRFAGLLVALCGCNALFGLDQTVPLTIDAHYFDAPPDAPFTCPAAGGTPQFSRLLHQIPQRCGEYATSSTGRAIAMCFEPTMQLAEGPLDDTLTPIPEFAKSGPPNLDHARYAPEGDELIVRRWDDGSVSGRILVYRRNDGAWTYDHDIKLPNNQAIDSFVRFGSPSRAPNRRLLVRNTTSDFDEIEIDATGASTKIKTITPASIGLTNLAGIVPNLSADGLRMVVYGASSTMSGMFYTDRASLADSFRAATLLDDVPGAGDPFLSEDCSRLYFSAIGSVFWVQQR